MDKQLYVSEDIREEFKKLLDDICSHYELSYAEFANLAGYDPCDPANQIMKVMLDEEHRFPVLHFYGCMETFAFMTSMDSHEIPDLRTRIDRLFEKQYRYIEGE